MKRALITGITGQDGSYLAELLLAKGYEVHGVIRRSSSFNTGRLEHVYQGPHEKERRLILHYGDLLDGAALRKVIESHSFDEVYNLGAQSHVRVSFDTSEYTSDVDAIGTLRLLNAIMDSGQRPRFYQASSSEMYGKVMEVPQKETTPFYPRSPYAVSKVYGYWITVNYREAYNLHASNGILFNHESPRRGETFVTRKITRTLARILAGKQKQLVLGNLDAKRDWGHAKDYVEAMWLMLQQSQGDDYVVATGETHSVREFLSLAFGMVGLDWEKFVTTDEKYLRPTEVDLLLGDPTKVKQKLGWTPKYSFESLVREMVTEDLRLENLDPHKLITEKPNEVPRVKAPLVLRTRPSFTDREAKIYLAGHRGLVGSAIERRLKAQGYRNILTRTSEALDLRDGQAVKEFLGREKPDYVFVVAGKVGGIVANSKAQTQFLNDNVLIATNVLAAAAECNVTKLLYLGSSCIYPRLAPQPIKEESLLTSALEKTNEGYALAKIVGVKLCEAYSKEQGKRFISAMPTNLYGPNDNFDPEQSHVLPGLLRRFHEAKQTGARQVQVWGTGNVRREFLHVDDLAEACLLLMNQYEDFTPINVGSGSDITIADLARLVKRVVGYEGEIVFDSTKPDGTPRKLLDSSRIKSLGFTPQFDLETGLKSTYAWTLSAGVFSTSRKKVA